MKDHLVACDFSTTSSRDLSDIMMFVHIVAGASEALATFADDKISVVLLFVLCKCIQALGELRKVALYLVASAKI